MSCCSDDADPGDLLANESEDEDDTRATPAPAPKTKRQPWTAVETSELKKYFKTFLDSKVTPSSKEVRKAKEKSKEKGGQLHARRDDLIIKKISAMNHK